MRIQIHRSGLRPLFLIFGIFLFVISPASETGGLDLLSQEGYPCFRGNNFNTGQSPYRVKKPSRPVWTLTVDGEFYAPPSQSPDGTIYAGATDDVLYALRPNGSIVFTRRITRSTFFIPFSTPTIAPDGTIYIGCRDWTVRTFHPDGTPGKVFHVDDSVRSAPLVDEEGSLYFGTGKTFFSYDASGKLRWSRAYERLIYPRPALTSNRRLLFTDGRHTLYCLDADTGNQLWRFQTEGFISDYPLALPDNRVVISCHSDSKNDVYLLNDRGAVEETYSYREWLPYTPLLGNDGTAYVASFSGYIYAITIDGKSQWKFKVPLSFPPAMTLDASGTLLVGGLDGYLYAIAKDGEFLWKYDIGSPIHAAPLIGQNGMIFVGTVDGVLFALG